MKTLRRGPSAPDREKVKLALSNVRLTSEKTYCPSLEFHPQYPVVKVPREASRPAALASGARKYFTGFPVGCQRLFSKFLKIRFQREPAATGPERPAAAPSSSADLVEYPFGSKSARGNLENSLNDIYATLATRATRKLPLACHAKPPPPSKSSLAEARSSCLTECLPFETKNTLSGVNHYSRNHFVAQARPRKSARVRQAPGIAPPRGRAASAPRRAPNKGRGRAPVGAAASAGPAVPPGRPERRKAPPASGTTCPPAASRRSTFGEVGLNCRVRNGIG